MSSIQALRERHDALNREAKNLLAEKGSAVWTKEDQAKFDGLMDEAERSKRQIEAHQRQLDADAEAHFRAAGAAERGTYSADDKRRLADLNKGMDIFLRKGTAHLTQEEATLFRNTMSTTTGSEGGYTVQPLVASKLIESLKAYGFMRAVATDLTTETGVDMAYPMTDGTAEVGEIVAQNQPASLLDISFATRSLNVFKYGSKVITVPIELLQDSSIDIQALVYRRMRDRIGRIENQHFTTGTGSGQPTGLVTAATVGKTGGTGQTTTVTYDDVVDLMDSLDVSYLDPNAAIGFMINQTLRRVVRKVKDTTGRPIWTPNYDEGITGSPSDMLMGYPVYINNDMPTPAANAKSMAFGNYKAYVIRDAMQVTMFRFDDSPFMTKGQVGFLAWARAGGNLMDSNAVKLYQHSAT